VGEGARAPAALVAREAGLLPGCYPVKEGGIRPVQARQHIVQDLRVDGCVLREGGAHLLEFALLLQARGGAPLPAPPPRAALFEGGGVERATAPQGAVQRPLLRGRGPELFLLGFAHRLHVGYRVGYRVGYHPVCAAIYR